MSFRKEFDQYFDYLMKTEKIDALSLRELAYKAYCQGSTKSRAKDIPIEDVEKWLENKEFFDFIESCIRHPEQMENKGPASGIVKVVYPCTAADKEKCIAWPDRCEECGGDGETCGYEYIDLAKLCGVDTDENKEEPRGSITQEEAKQLAEKLLEYAGRP